MLMDYLDGFQYAGGELQFFPTAEGYVNVTSGTTGNRIFNYVFNYTDHLGNIRLSFTKDPVSNELKILEENHYYPFGLKHGAYADSKQKYKLADDLEDVARPGYVTKTDYNYKFGAKEWQDELGLNIYDFEARNYMPDIVRTPTMDPLADNFAHQSPYSFFNNDPIRFADPTGMAGEDFVKRGDGSIYWDNNANDQASTKAGDTYLGKELSFTFNSYIGSNYDGPLGSLPEGDKLTTTINLSASENSSGELTGLSATKTTEFGETFGISFLKGRDYYPGEGGSNNYFTKSGMSINYEQHASVPGIEEIGLNSMGFKIVDVAQKLNISFDKGSGNLSVSAYTNIFPSATLKLNNTNTTLMNYTQPSFIKTHTAPIKGYSPPAMGEGRTGGQPIRDFSYYPSKFYKRN